MIIGNPDAWKSRFIRLDERMLSRILHVWPACMALLPNQPEEDVITTNLVDLLWRDSIVRKICYFIAYQHEPFGTHSNGTKYSKGKIDIAVLLDQERERYIAYECKRLNVVSAGGRRSLATLYATDGMMRFLTEQYAENLPVGCMLGYVMDSDLPFAFSRITDAINAHKVPLGKINGIHQNLAIPGIERFSTLHQRLNKSIIEIRHVLLPFLSAKNTDVILPCI
jgi:hypothetical protein